MSDLDNKCRARSCRTGGVYGQGSRWCNLPREHPEREHVDSSGSWTHESLRVYDVGQASRELADAFTRLFAAMIARDE